MMITNYDAKKTLSPENQFHFACPIFGAETSMASCMTLHDMVWMGRKPDQRKGCQLCMKVNKCPVHHIIGDMMRTDSDPYHSVERKTGKLSDRHMAAIERILVSDKEIDTALENGRLSNMEAKKIREANQTTHELTASVKTRRDPNDMPLDDMPAVKYHRKPKIADTEAPVGFSSEISNAAMTGDLSAALNAATKEF